MHVDYILNYMVLIDRWQCVKMVFKQENESQKKVEMIYHRRVVAKKMDMKVSLMMKIILLIFLKKMHFFIDLKSSQSHQSTIIQTQSLLSTDRNHSNKLSSPTSSASKLHLAPSSVSRNYSLQSVYANTPSSSSIHSHHTNTLYPSNAPSKYDLPHGSQHLHHGTPTGTSDSYLHPNSHSSPSSQQPYANNVKSESSAPLNYDYMNNCIQNSYFGNSFTSLNTTTGVHVATDHSSYHHQHNVIQAAKLMASS